MKLSEMYFDTYDECERNRDEYNRKQSWFCPLIKELCRQDCICYNPGPIAHQNAYGDKKTRNKFNTYGGYCTYKLFQEE